MKQKSSPLLSGLLATLAVVFLFCGFEYLERQRFRESLHVHAINKLSQIRAGLEAEINANFYLTRGLIAYVTTHPDLTQEIFHRLADDLLLHRNHIRNIGLAPGNILAFVHPLEGNEKAIGLDYTANEKQWPAVKKAIDSQKTVVAGPVRLVQGGTAFISRTPIYVSSRSDREKDQYWGLASIVIDKERLFQSARLHKADPDIRIAVRGADGLGEKGGFIDGDPQVFEENPVLLDVHLSEGSWQLAAVPRNGWETPSPYIGWLRGTGLILSLLTGWGFFSWLTQQRRSRREIEKALKNTEQARKALQQNENFLNIIIEHMPNVLFVKEADELRFVRLNRAGEELLGCSREELIGKNDYDFFTREEADFYTGKDKEVLKNGKMLDIPSETVHTKYKGTRIMHTRKIPIFNNRNVPEYLLGISEDITEQIYAEKERQKLDEHMQQVQKMEAIGTLAGGIAHEFNNLLGVIRGFTELAQWEAPEGSTIHNDLEKVLIAANRATDLVAQILAFSRHTKSEWITLHLQPIVRETVKFLRPSLPATIHIQQEIHPQCNPISADPAQIHQVIMNLCTNAFHAMKKKDGTLTIGLEETELKAGDLINEVSPIPGHYAKLTVSDTGSGIDPSIRKRIFEPFFTTKEVGKGTGMGLAMVHGIVKNHGGMIQLESEIGRGTSFQLFFPTIADKGEEVSKSEERIFTGSEQVLFVDDEAFLAQLGKDMLSRLGYTVTALADSGEALKIFRGQPDRFDLVITDQTMPGITGYELSRKILAIRPDIPIILCSGHSSVISKEEALALGIREFVMKPLTGQNLARIIRQILDDEKNDEKNTDN